MNASIRRTSLFFPFVILTAIAFALYLLVVWDPIGIYGSVRQYLEHPIRVPLEWIVLLLTLSWIIIWGFKGDVAVVLMFLMPPFLLILWLSSPDGGVWFWSIFKREIVLSPVYIPRGFLLYFFFMCFVLAIMARLKSAWQATEQKTMLLVCLVIVFLLTSCEAVFAEPSLAARYTGSEADNSFGDLLRNTAQEWWKVVEGFIDQHVQDKYRNAIKIAASLYPFVAFVLLLFPSYRRLPKEILTKVIEDEFFPVFFVLVGGLLGLTFWALSAAQHMADGPAQYLLSILGIPAVLFMLLLALTSIVWIPIVLLLLPAFVFAIVSLPFKLAYFLLVAGVRAPLIIWHSLHYLFVPHPAETAYNAGMARHVPLTQLAADVANAMYQYDMRDYDRLPSAWRSRNWQRRMEAFRHRLRAENDFMQELERNIRLREQSSMNRS
jgi:hypothetical protein